MSSVLDAYSFLNVLVFSVLSQMDASRLSPEGTVHLHFAAPLATLCFCQYVLRSFFSSTNANFLVGDMHSVHLSEWSLTSAYTKPPFW